MWTTVVVVASTAFVAYFGGVPAVMPFVVIVSWMILGQWMGEREAAEKKAAHRMDDLEREINELRQRLNVEHHLDGPPENEPVRLGAERNHGKVGIIGD